MQTLDNISALRALRETYQLQGKTVGFVPTMGNLHDGHLKLVKAAKAACDVVIVSIFVNPMQFGANEDLDSYPRTQQEDCDKLTALGTDAVFLPSVNDVYPRGLEAQTFVEVPGLSSVICGASRSGHFRGVATVVCKLFNMVRPHQAFFGEKDYQQVQVIKTMVTDLSMDISVIAVPTERQADGLALSSRNGYLNTNELELAPALYNTICHIRDELLNGERDFARLSEKYCQLLSQTGFRPDYIEIREASTLQPATRLDEELVILIAAYLGRTRLIDNLRVNLN